MQMPSCTGISQHGAKVAARMHMLDIFLKDKRVDQDMCLQEEPHLQ